MDGSENLIPWKPGESGNPEGSSRKARHKALLRAAFAERAGKVLPKELSDRLTLLTEDDRKKLKEQVEGLTYAEALASRKWLEALFGDTVSSAKATDQIIGTEPKLVEVDLQQEAASHNFIPDEDEQQQLRNEIAGNGHDKSETLQ